MNDYQARKEARRAAYKANAGKPQGRRVFRVYATSIMFEVIGTPLAGFSSRAEAVAFAFGKYGCEHDISSYEGAPAWKTLSSRMPNSSISPAYVRFFVKSEAA